MWYIYSGLDNWIGHKFKQYRSEITNFPKPSRLFYFFTVWISNCPNFGAICPWDIQIWSKWAIVQSSISINHCKSWVRAVRRRVYTQPISALTQLIFGAAFTSPERCVFIAFFVFNKYVTQSITLVFNPRFLLWHYYTRKINTLSLNQFDQ